MTFTAETITDEQIEELWESLSNSRADERIDDACFDALEREARPDGSLFTSADRRAARARCATAWNARQGSDS